MLLSRFESVFEGDQNELINFSTFLLNRCFLVAVSTDSQDSAFRVFSVMNSRGLDLLPIDIIKSEIIGENILDMIKKELDNTVVRNLAEVMMFLPDDGEKMRGDIIKIRNTILKIAVKEDENKSKSEGSGPVMLGELNIDENSDRLRRDAEIKCVGNNLSASANYKEPYNTVPRVVN